MNDQLPAEVEQDAELDHQAMEAECRKMCNKLVSAVQQYTADRTRLRNLVLFQERDHGETKKRPRSKVATYDRPEVELILFHSEHVVRLERLTSNVQVSIDHQLKQEDHDPKALGYLIEQMNKLEEKRLKHAAMLEAILADANKSLDSKEVLTAKIIGDTVNLTQRMAEHRDKMDLANKSASIPTTAELKERLAHKYGVPVEQVEAILAAKTADAEVSDG